MTAAQQRKVLRVVHLVAAFVLVGIVIAPVGGYLHYGVSFIALAVLVVTGIAMWQAPRIRRLLKSGGRKPAAD